MLEQLELPLSYRPIEATKRIGLVVLSTDHTTEIEFARQISPLGVEIFTSRVAFSNPTTPQRLRAMAPNINASAASILPDTHLDVVYYACTSGAVHIGNQKIIDAVQAEKPDAEVITPVTAAIEAFKFLNIKNVALMTPYLAQTSADLAPCFELEGGVNIVRHCYLGLGDDREMARLDANTLTRAAIAADHSDADAMFISCTALRAVEVAGAIEKEIGKPVITSNQAAIWQTLRLVGVEGPATRDNRLFAADLG